MRIYLGAILTHPMMLRMTENTVWTDSQDYGADEILYTTWIVLFDKINRLIREIIILFEVSPQLFPSCPNSFQNLSCTSNTWLLLYQLGTTVCYRGHLCLSFEESCEIGGRWKTCAPSYFRHLQICIGDQILCGLESFRKLKLKRWIACVGGKIMPERIVCESKCWS